jgi:YebC/PmpR family DNA-binding regulatory protein
MSGHSKWSTIKRQKGLNDAKRGALFTRIGNQIAIAARGGADPKTNPTLAMAVEKARSANMPMQNIERAIQRVADKNAAQLQEVTYEGYGPGGVGILVECATDNLNRTFPEVKHSFAKHGGNIAAAGAVAYLFTHKGVIRIPATGDEAMLAALDAGAEDVIEENDDLVIYTDAKQLASVRDKLQQAGIQVKEAELTYMANQTVEISDSETAQKIMNLMDALDELNDVVATHTNFDIADGIEL